MRPRTGDHYRYDRSWPHISDNPLLVGYRETGTWGLGRSRPEGLEYEYRCAEYEHEYEHEYEYE